MPWTAPEVTRPARPDVADERTMLEAWLDFHRQTLLMKCTGLSAEQLKRRSTHRVADGSHPPPAPTERSVRISRTTLFRR